MATAPQTDPIASATADMPDVQPHAVEAERAQTARVQEQNTAQTQGATDRHGKPFDPAKHETNADGSPRITAAGNLALKRGRGAASFVADTAPEPAHGVTSPMVAGRNAAELLFVVGQLVGGEEWAPVTDAAQGVNERAQMGDAFSAYFETQGWDDIPPGYALCIAVVGYVTPRMFMPKTKTRFARAKDWAVRKYIDFKLRRRGIDPRSNYGNDGERKDNGSETTIEGAQT